METETDRAGTNFAAGALKALIERIERLEEEKSELMTDISEIYKEAKGNGYDVKILREIVRLRKKAAAERQEHDAIMETYLAALGM